MKLLKDVVDKIRSDIQYKIQEHSSYDSFVHWRIQKNIGWWDNDSLIRLKVINLQWNIGNDLDEID